jgi:ectoine hydroxylase-related dioxygenase (phytanoyl-CoA dioxygenase family)
MASPTRARAHESYRADGYYIASEPVIPLTVVQAASDGMDAIRRGDYDTGRPPDSSPWNPGDDPNRLCKIEQPQLASRAVYELIRHPALGALAAEVTGASMVQAWWVQLLHKPPLRADAPEKTSVGWHQDRHYWGIWEDGSELFTAWVAISDVGEETGPMRFVRGSHRWGLWEKGGDFYEQDLEGQRDAIRSPDGEAWEEATALLPPGGVSFHHCLTYHGSGPNVSDVPRRSFAIHMRTQNSGPIGGRREGLARYIDDPAICPVIFGSL